MSRLAVPAQRLREPGANNDVKNLSANLSFHLYPGLQIRCSLANSLQGAGLFLAAQWNSDYGAEGGISANCQLEPPALNHVWRQASIYCGQPPQLESYGH